jgi:DNA-binding CsgD family transcriptional regulator
MLQDSPARLDEPLGDPARQVAAKNRGVPTMWKRVLLYGALLAAGTLGLQWLDVRRLARSHSAEVYVAIVAAAFLALGVYVGARVFGGRAPVVPDGNPKAVSTLGISPRELEVLQELAAGRSNKEIARELDVSPNTVKTHVARLFEKLGARRRTDAIQRARELGILR